MRKVVVTRSLDLVGDEEDGLLHISRVDFKPKGFTVDSAGQPVWLGGTLTVWRSDGTNQFGDFALPFDSHATELRNLLGEPVEALSAFAERFPAFDFTATEHVKVPDVADSADGAGGESQSDEEPKEPAGDELSTEESSS